MLTYCPPRLTNLNVFVNPSACTVDFTQIEIIPGFPYIKIYTGMPNALILHCGAFISEEDAKACVLWQQGKLVILSCAYGPFDPDTLRVIVPNEKALKNAAIEGARATIQSTYSRKM